MRTSPESARLLGELWLHTKAGTFIASYQDLFLWYKSIGSVSRYWLKSEHRLRDNEFTQHAVLASECWNAIAQVLLGRELATIPPEPTSQVGRILDADVDEQDYSRELSAGPLCGSPEVRGHLLAEMLITTRVDLWRLGFALSPSEDLSRTLGTECLRNGVTYPDFLVAIPSGLFRDIPKGGRPANTQLAETIADRYNLSGPTHLVDIHATLSRAETVAGFWLLQHLRDKNPDSLRNAIQEIERLAAFFQDESPGPIAPMILEGELPPYTLRYLLKRLHGHAWKGAQAGISDVGFAPVSIHRTPGMNVIVVWPQHVDSLVWSAAAISAPRGFGENPYPYLDACLGSRGTSGYVHNLALRVQQLQGTLNEAKKGYLITRYGAEMLRTGWRIVDHAGNIVFLVEAACRAGLVPQQALRRLLDLTSQFFAH